MVGITATEARVLVEGTRHQRTLLTDLQTQIRQHAIRGANQLVGYYSPSTRGLSEALLTLRATGFDVQHRADQDLVRVTLSW